MFAVFHLFYYIIFFVAGLFLFSFILSFAIVFFRVGMRFPEVRKRPLKPFVLKRIFVDFPYRYWKDFFAKDPDEFPYYGFHLICGEQGSGKTVALTEFLLRIQSQFPKVKVATNYDYLFQDEAIFSSDDIVGKGNGIYGKILVLDEVQNWFNSLESKNFPVDMITEISQQRKQRKMILGTSQVFNRVAKPIREQVHFLYLPFTILGCLTFVPVFKPLLNDDAQCEKKKFLRVYFFVHNDKIRDSFDTYKKIERMSKSGYSPRSEFFSYNKL
jgi:hypothetical protein